MIRGSDQGSRGERVRLSRASLSVLNAYAPMESTDLYSVRQRFFLGIFSSSDRELWFSYTLLCRKAHTNP